MKWILDSPLSAWRHDHSPKVNPEARQRFTFWYTSSGDWLLLGWAEVISVDFVVVVDETTEELAANGVDKAECVLASSMGGVATAADASAGATANPVTDTGATPDSAGASDAETNPSFNAAGASSTGAAESDGDAVVLEGSATGRLAAAAAAYWIVGVSAGRGIVVCRVDPFVVAFDVAAAVGVGAATGAAAGFVSLGSEMDSSNNKSIEIRESADCYFHCYSASICRV